MQEQEDFLRLLLECLESGRADEALESAWERCRVRRARVRGEKE